MEKALEGALSEYCENFRDILLTPLVSIHVQDLALLPGSAVQLPGGVHGG